MIESLFMGDGAVFMKISDGATACDVRHNFQGAVDLTSYKERAITYVDMAEEVEHRLTTGLSGSEHVCWCEGASALLRVMAPSVAKW